MLTANRGQPRRAVAVGGNSGANPPGRLVFPLDGKRG